MVSLRCKLVVEAALKTLGLPYRNLDLGMVELVEEISSSQREALKKNLLKSGLEVLDDKKSILIEKIKVAIIEMIPSADQVPKVNYSESISEKLGYDYTYLSHMFSEVHGTTIQQLIILRKIELVKELLLYDEMNLTQIAHILHYSSVGNLSAQFKNITGLPPSFFKELKHKCKSNLVNR